jgi:hypothetical protein
MYHGHESVVVLPPGILTIAPTRQYILDNLVGEDEPFCMVDDDLLFFKRRDDDRTKLRDLQSGELLHAFIEMERILRGCEDSRVAHVGFAAREGANRNTEEYLYNTRIMRVLGYSSGPLKEHGIRFDEMEVMEDFHVALSLLERGYDNMVMNEFAHNQAGGSGAVGGCSHFRTPELQAANAHKLAELHPGVVKVTKKVTKGAWGGGERTDVTVYWKKARTNCV